MKTKSATTKRKQTASTTKLLEGKAKQLILDHFKIIVKRGLTFSQKYSTWEAAVDSAELTLNQQIDTVAHQRDLFSSSFKVVSGKMFLVGHDGIAPFKKWCDDHIKELKYMQDVVRKIQRPDITTTVHCDNLDQTEFVSMDITQ